MATREIWHEILINASPRALYDMPGNLWSPPE